MRTIKTWVTETTEKMGMAAIKRRVPVLKELLETPENLKLEAYIENDEIVVKLKKKEEGE